MEVGNALNYPRQFPITDCNGHRRTGTQIISAAFGLAPKDFDLFLGLYTYLRRLPELPADGRTHLTVDFIARTLGLPATCQKDYLRIRSRIFRFSYVKYTNSAFWNPETKTTDIMNFGFFNIASLSRVTESRRPVTFEWDPTFLRLVGASAYLAFDYALYQTLPPAMRRLYLIANRDGWNQRESGISLADDFAVNQIGYSDNPALAKMRRQKLRGLLSDAEDLGIVRPCSDWNGYFRTATKGAYNGRTLLRLTTMPMGGKVGTQVEVTITGEHLDDAEDLIFSDSKITAKRKLDAAGEPIANRYVVAIAADCTAGVVGRSVIGVAVAGNSHWAGDVGQFQNVGQRVGRTALALDHSLYQDRRIGRQPETFRRHLDPPFLALLGVEFEYVHVGRRIKPTRDVAGQRNSLGMRAIVVGLDFRDLSLLRTTNGRPRVRIDLLRRSPRRMTRQFRR